MMFWRCAAAAANRLAIRPQGLRCQRIVGIHAVKEASFVPIKLLLLARSPPRANSLLDCNIFTIADRYGAYRFSQPRHMARVGRIFCKKGVEHILCKRHARRNTRPDCPVCLCVQDWYTLSSVPSTHLLGIAMPGWTGLPSCHRHTTWH